MILLAYSALLNSTMTLEAAFVGALRVNHPMYLISACGMNGLLSSSSWSLVSSNLSMSIVLVRMS